MPSMPSRYLVVCEEGVVCDLGLNAGPQPANAALIAAAPALLAELKRAAHMLSAVAVDLEDGGSLDSLRGKYVMALVEARDDARAAIAAAEVTP
jgi:hypothetical protein